MTTENAPPMKPRGPRRWPWVVVVAFVAYVCCYVGLRSAGRLQLFQDDLGRLCVTDLDAPITEVESGGVEGQGTWPVTWYAPCIAIEEWWLNR